MPAQIKYKTKNKDMGKDKIMKLSNEQILKKAIEKAGNNGNKYCAYIFKHWKQIDNLNDFRVWEGRNYFSTIFSHDFAKAFWGERDKKRWPVDRIEYTPWEKHLQQMVLEEEPLKYIEKFL